MLPSTNIQSIIGATLFGADDAKIGRITKVLVDAADGHPTFAEVHTGFLGHATRMVPLDDARWERDDVYVSFSADEVKNAPRQQGSEGLSPDEENELRRHYAGEADGDGDGGGRDGDGRDDVRLDGDRVGRDEGDHAVPPLPAELQDGQLQEGQELQEGQVIREERLVVRREPAVTTDDGTGRHADTGDAPRI
jgi:hypothetical protein